MKEQKKLKPGERTFSLVVLAFSLWLLYQSVQMWRKAPGFTSFGAMPLVLSVIMVVCMLIVIFIEDLKAVTDNPGKTVWERIRFTASYILPINVAIFIGLVVIYCVLLFLGAGFLISSAFFMLATMTYLMPKDMKTVRNNILFAVILLGVIYIVFQLVFKVTLP